MAKKFPLLRARSVSCTVIETNFIHCAPYAALFKGCEDYCNSKETPPIIGFNPFNETKERAAKPFDSAQGRPVERRARSRNFDFYV